MPIVAPDAPSSPPLVILANDQEWSARSLESVLGPRGFATVRAFTGKQALELVRTTRCDAIVLDVGLPDLSGLDVCRMLRDEPSFQAGIPVILLTSSTPTRAQKLEAYKSGAWELLSEPYDIDALVLKLDLFVRAKREADRTIDSGLLDGTTGVYNARGIARRAREIGAEAARRQHGLACIAFAARVEGPPGSMESGVDTESLVAARLSEACLQNARVSDAVGRLGRTELVIIAPSADAAGAERIVARVRSTVESTPLKHGDRSSTLRLVAGYTAVGDFSKSSSDVVSLLLRAASELRVGRLAGAGATGRVLMSKMAIGL